MECDNDINLGQSIRDQVLHQSIHCSPEVDVATSVGLRVVGILLALKQILYEELGLPWNNDQGYFYFIHLYKIKVLIFPKYFHSPPTYPDRFLLSVTAFLEGRDYFLFLLRLY